ncbi:unnamed protein product [Phaedon cochleariae]|uniref:THAP-type domain-containing protein n=1 Tax=Phaedon cochleariae TaxID=80249 RepID=A0A9P0DLD9_PHACE|nr:unnamed protein product [Phaedon cochleariae]
MNKVSKLATTVIRRRADVEQEGILKQCEFEGCNSDSRYSTISFINFPKPCLRVRNVLIKPVRRHIESCPSCNTCQRWVNMCLGKDKNSPRLCDIKKNAYICSSHFVDREPSTQFPDPLPVGQVLKIRFQRSKVKKIDDEKEHNDHQEISEHPKTPAAEISKVRKIDDGKKQHKHQEISQHRKTPTVAKKSKIRKIDDGKEQHNHQEISQHPKTTGVKGVKPNRSNKNVPDTLDPSKIAVTNRYSDKENKVRSTQTGHVLASQDTPDPSSISYDAMDLTNFLVSTSKTFQLMCDELRVSTILNNNINYVNACKERITLETPAEEGGQSFEILIVNNTPDDTAPSLIDTATELENMVKEMETMLSESEVSRIVNQDKNTQTNLTSEAMNQQFARLENDNVQLKIQVTCLKTTVLQLQRELKMEREGRNLNS